MPLILIDGTTYIDRIKTDSKINFTGHFPRDIERRERLNCSWTAKKCKLQQGNYRDTENN